jgi:hypothetical protein
MRRRPKGRRASDPIRRPRRFIAGWQLELGAAQLAEPGQELVSQTSRVVRTADRLGQDRADLRLHRSAMLSRPDAKALAHLVVEVAHADSSHLTPPASDAVNASSSAS